MSESAFRPDWFSKPGDTLAKLMAARGLTVHALADQAAMDVETVRGLLIGTNAVTSAVAQRLAKYVGGGQEFWEARQAAYDAALSRVTDSFSEQEVSDWLEKIPVRDMAANGWIQGSRKPHERAKACLAYFAVSSPSDWENRYASIERSAVFRKSAAFKSQAGAVATWLRRGELEAELVLCHSWDREKLYRSLGELRFLSKAKSLAYFMPKIRRLCAEAGVAIVYVPTPSGCSASGATRFITKNKAVVILSFRHRSNDHFWFTLFHELGHLLLHEEGETFIDFDEPLQDKREQEANDFARSWLVPPDKAHLLKSVKHRANDVIRLAVSLGISPGIVVGQLQHHGIIHHSKLNFMKERYAPEEIQAAFN